MALTSTNDKPVQYSVPYVYYDGDEEDIPVRIIATDRSSAFVFYDGDSDSDTDAKKTSSQQGANDQSSRKSVLQKIACGLCFNSAPVTNYHDLVHTPESELQVSVEGDNPFFTTTTAEDSTSADIEDEQDVVVPREAPVFEVTVEETLQDDEPVAGAAVAPETADEMAISSVTTTQESTTIANPSPSAPARISPSPSSSVALSQSIAAGASTSANDTILPTENADKPAVKVSPVSSSPKKSSPNSPSPLMERLNKFKKILNTRSPTQSPNKVESLQVSEPLSANDVAAVLIPESPAPAPAPDALEIVSPQDIQISTTKNTDGLIHQHEQSSSSSRFDTSVMLGANIPSFSEDMKHDEASMLSTTAPSSVPAEWSIQKATTAIPPLHPSDAAILTGTPPSAHPLEKKEPRYRLSLDIRKTNRHKSTNSSSLSSTPATTSQAHPWTNSSSQPITTQQKRSSTMSSTTVVDGGVSEPGSLNSISEHLMHEAAADKEGRDKPKKKKSVLKKIGKGFANITTKRRQGSIVLESPVEISEEPQAMDRRSSF